MHAPETKPRPTLRPFLSASARFASGEDTPSAFLERCLAAYNEWEPKIGAFVHVDLAAARAAAERSTGRGRAGKPRSPIDGMPVGIKDIIETANFPTGQGSPLWDGFRTERDAASVVALEEAGAVIVGKTVTTEFASTEPRGTRNPWDQERTPGGSSSGSAAAVATGILPAGLGTQVIGSTIRPASFCGCFGFKPTVGALNRGGSYDGLSQSCTGVLAATLTDAWQVAYEIAARAGGDPGYPGLYGPATVPAAAQPRRLAFLETGAWTQASSQAKERLGGALDRLKGAGIEIATRHTDARIAEVETSIIDARAVSMRINAWEWRWPLNTYRNRDASKLSAAALSRLKEAEEMTLADYRKVIAERARIRATYARLKEAYDACVTLAASGAAPQGLGSTGDPAFAVPFSLLGVPAISLPVLEDQKLPLGLQLVGFDHEDAALFATAAFAMTLFDLAPRA